MQKREWKIATGEFPPLRAVLVERVDARQQVLAEHPVEIFMRKVGERDYVRLHAQHAFENMRELRRHAWIVMVGNAVFQRRVIRGYRLDTARMTGSTRAMDAPQFAEYGFNTTRKHFETLLAKVLPSA